MHYHPDQGEKGLSARDARLRRQKKDAAVARCYAIVFIIELFVMIVISIGLVISVLSTTPVDTDTNITDEDPVVTQLMARALSAGNFTYYGNPNVTRTGHFLHGTGSAVQVVTVTTTLNQVATTATQLDASFVTDQIMETVVENPVTHHEGSSPAHAKSVVVATMTVTENQISSPTVTGGVEETWSETTTVTFTPTVTLTRTVTEDYTSAEYDIAGAEATTPIRSSTIPVDGGATTVHVTQDSTIYHTLLPQPTDRPDEACDMAETVYITMTRTVIPTAADVKSSSGIFEPSASGQEHEFSRELVTVTRTMQRNTTVTPAGVSEQVQTATPVQAVPPFPTANGTAITTLLSIGTHGTAMPFANATTIAPVLVSGGETRAEHFRVGGGAFVCSVVVFAVAVLLI